MGDQCVNICKVIPMSGHEPPADEEMVRLILTMGAHARSLIGQAKRAFEARDVEMALDLVERDDAVVGVLSAIRSIARAASSRCVVPFGRYATKTNHGSHPSLAA